MAAITVDEVDTIDGADCIEPTTEGIRGDIATRFQPGHKHNVSKPRGKARLSGRFIDDLTNEWRNRGAQALQEITAKDLVNTCVQILPKDVLLSMSQDDRVRWVINAQPMSIEDWSAQHHITHETVDVPSDATGEPTAALNEPGHTSSRGQG